MRHNESKVGRKATPISLKDFSMNKLIIEIGKLLHGEQFVSPLANDLDINRKTIQRYISEEVAVNPNLYPEILNLLKQHQKKANHLIEKVEAYCNEHKYAIKIFNQGEFKVERDYLKKLVEDGKKVILDTDFYTYRNDSIFNKNKNPIVERKIKFDGVDGKYIKMIFLDKLADGTVNDDCGLQLHVSNINLPQHRKRTLNYSNAKAIYNAVFSGLACYVDQNLNRPVMVLDGVVIESKTGEKLSKEDFFNIWYYAPNNEGLTWQKAEALGMYSFDVKILEVE